MPSSSPQTRDAAVSHRRHIPFGRKLLYAGLVTLLMFGVCEGALRFRMWLRYGTASSSVRDPMLTYDSAAGLYVPKPGYEVHGAKINIRINSHGFRGDEFVVPKPRGVFRIVCLGASTTFSAEASSNDTIWTHRLQEQLRAALPGRTIEVINAAVGGYVAEDNLRNLRHRVLALDPDLVIYYDANNEIVRDTQELAKDRGLLANSGGQREPALVKTLSTYSVMFDLAYKNLAIVSRSRASQSPAQTLDSIPSSLPNRFIGVLDEMRRELASRNVPLVLSTFVVKYRHDQDRATQIANADVAFYYMPWMSIDGMLHAMDTYNAAILEYGRRARLVVVDERTTIPADSDHFADCMHLTDRGNEAMAQRFFRALMASGLIHQGGGAAKAAA